MREMLHVKEEEYVKQVEEAKRHMDEASAFIAAKLKEQHQAMFKVLFATKIRSSLFQDIMAERKVASKRLADKQRDAEDMAEL